MLKCCKKKIFSADTSLYKNGRRVRIGEIKKRALARGEYNGSDYLWTFAAKAGGNSNESTGVPNQFIRMKHYICISFAILIFCAGILHASETLDSIRQQLVDKNATAETAALFYNLKRLAAEGKTLVGAQDPDVTNSRLPEAPTDIKAITGQELAVWGHDFMSIARSAPRGAPNYDQIRRGAENQARISREFTINAYNQGIVNTFCWHFREPESQSFNARSLSDEKRDTFFRSLLPGGDYHEWYKEQLQIVADFAKSVRGADGTLAPIIFRPYHEFDGDWFWWGFRYCTPEEFIENWRFTVRYLRDELEVRNFLYCFSPDNRFNSEEQFLERYPGDDYVDIIAMDNYSDFENNRIEAAAKKLAIMSDYAIRSGKLAGGLTEVGHRGNPPPEDVYTAHYGRVHDDPELQAAMLIFWRGFRYGGVPAPDNSPWAENFLEFMSSPRMLLLPDVGNLYALPEFRQR